MKLCAILTLLMLTKCQIVLAFSNSGISNAGQFFHLETCLYGARENEIRRKIMKLKKTGKISNSKSSGTTNEPIEGETKLEKMTRERQNMQNNPVMDSYKDKISQKLGSKAKLLPSKFDLDDAEISASPMPSSGEVKTSDTDDINNISGDDMDEEEVEMMEAVERALAKKRAKAAAEAEKNKTPTVDEMEKLAQEMEEEIKRKEITIQEKYDSAESTSGPETDEVVDVKKTTTGIGGAWAKNETSPGESYRPANGGWGYFPRPKDISKAYGGGKRIGADIVTTMEDERRKEKAVEDTREKLRRYREKVGIEVQSEKDHAAEIAEALELAQRAMQRGIYGTATSSLEKVTQYCSTNSEVGGQVFLELAMAYEAVGRSGEAIQIYTTLSTCRMETIKFNAKRLLYGIEAMQFMREEAKVKSFSKKRATETFIETTGLGNIADNFDDKYNTAYIDLDRRGGFYKKLTESVVRSIREARQIILAATNSGEVDRTKIVQALRSIDRSFSDALAKEMKKNEPDPEPLAMMNGKPIERKKDDNELIAGIAGLESINLGDMNQVLENLSGEWKLQLMADSKGDGVNFFNKTISWQSFDAEEKNYKAFSPSGFLSVSQTGSFAIDDIKRVISRSEVSKEGSAAFFTDLYSTRLTGAVAAVNLPQQIISIDSELLITRGIGTFSVSETSKGYYSVWRRSEDGAYSSR